MLPIAHFRSVNQRLKLTAMTLGTHSPAPNPTVEIRPLAVGDVSDVVELHMAAFGEYFMTQLGRSFLTAFFTESLTEIALVATMNGRVAGYHLTVTDPGQFYATALRTHGFAFAWAAIRAAMAKPGLAPRAAIGVLKPWRSRRPRGVATAMFTAVSPEAQGGGLAKGLLHRMIVEAHARQTRVILGENRNDPKLNSLYERVGFEIGEPEPDADGELYVRTYMDVEAAYSALQAALQTNLARTG